MMDGQNKMGAAKAAKRVVVAGQMRCQKATEKMANKERSVGLHKWPTKRRQNRVREGQERGK